MNSRKCGVYRAPIVVGMAYWQLTVAYCRLTDAYRALTGSGHNKKAGSRRLFAECRLRRDYCFTPARLMIVAARFISEAR